MNNVVPLPARSIVLTLRVTDPEVLHELERHDDGAPRETFASQALRLGVLALRQANGALDADTIRREGDRLLASVSSVLQERTSDLSGALANAMLQYLDPLSGTLPQKLEQLTKPHGDLEKLLSKHLQGDQSMIAQTLAKHVGEESPLFRLLSPKQSDGLLAALAESLRKALAAQKDELLRQFSLDHEGSALQRLSIMLAKTGEAVETSLTLDDEASPLARLKREILDVLSAHATANVTFQAEVRSTLETFKVRREEAARSTLHGHTFEQMVGEFLEGEARRVGDVCEHVGATPGRAQRKLGDFVVELGPESAAPSARVVCEAKAKKRYTVKNALAELAEARHNRDAQVGVFVFDRASAPEKMEPICRIGSDVLVVWDADDATTDTYLRAAFAIARTLAFRQREADARSEADVRKLEDLVEEIASHATSLEAIEKAARTVKKNGEAILGSAETLREALERQVAALRGCIPGLANDA